MALAIDTYFGFFARSVFTAIGSSIATQTGRPVELASVAHAGTNTLKLRWSEVETVLIPRMAEPADPAFCLALASSDLAALTRLAAGRVSLQTLMEQAVGAAIEPFNFVTKTRNRLRSLLFSRNVTGLTASHLGGAVRYTMATAAYRSAGGAGFSLRLLLAPGGRDKIEERAAQQAPQRALFTINAGAYVCRPQWDPPPPPPGAERGAGLSENAMNGWLQSFLGRNDGEMANRLFKRPAGLNCALVKPEVARKMLGGDPPTAVRLHINGDPALEVFVLVSQKVKRLLLQLSKSGQEKFLGDFFRALFTESAQAWERFGQTPVRWSVAAVREIPPDSLGTIEARLKGGGFMLRQVARLDDGFLEWALAISPHAWRWLMLLTAQGMGLGTEGAPDRAAIHAASGWEKGAIPWPALLRHLSARDLTECARLIAQSFPERPQAVLSAFSQALPPEAREPWLAAMPADLKDRTQLHKPEPGEAERLLPGITGALLRLNRAGKVPEGKLSAWLTLYAEQLWTRRQALADALLPLRHLVYGMDRASLSRLMVDARDAMLVEIMSLAEFPVVDQLRRAVPPGFGLRLLEDVAVKRAKINAYTAQEAQFSLYRLAARGLEQGRLMIRATPAERLRQVLVALGEA